MLSVAFFVGAFDLLIVLSCRFCVWIYFRLQVLGADLGLVSFYVVFGVVLAQLAVGNHVGFGVVAMHWVLFFAFGCVF